MKERYYLCIDLKSYYASVECAARGLDPLTAKLLVADESRSDQTICLAVSPALKAIGVPSRPRLFEARQAIRLYEAAHHCCVDYYIAVPRMAEYERVSAQIFSIYLRHVAPQDIHIYSIDECFIDCTPYLAAYEKEAAVLGILPARLMAITMIQEVLAKTKITATVGIGTNLYLAKIAMDIVAKKSPPDRNGVRIAELDEKSYILQLWDHRPLRDFWHIGSGTARRLAEAQMFTMGEVAERSIWDEEYFYKTFGVDGEILIDHAWGLEPVTMQDIKAYQPSAHSVSNGQVLPRPYLYEEARLILSVMIDLTCADLFRKQLCSSVFSWWVSYDYRSFDFCPDYRGPIAYDSYGRIHPRHSGGTVRIDSATNSSRVVAQAVLKQFDEKANHKLLFRRLGTVAENTAQDFGREQMDLFVDQAAENRERRLQVAMLETRQKHGLNSVFKGKNLLKASTQLARNVQIGGHRV